MCRRSLRGRRSQRPHSGYTDYGDYADYSGYQPRGTNTLVEEQKRGCCQGGDYADYADYARGTRRHLSDYAADYDVATVSQVVGTSLCAASALPAICPVTRWSRVVRPKPVPPLGRCGRLPAHPELAMRIVELRKRRRGVAKET